MTLLSIFCNLLIISVLWIGIIDEVSFVDEFGIYLTKITRSKLPLKIPKPFNCSLCSYFWASIIYLLIVKAFTVKYLAIVVLFCVMIPVTTHLIYSIQGFFQGLLNLFDHLTGQDQ